MVKTFQSDAIERYICLRCRTLVHLSQIMYLYIIRIKVGNSWVALDRLLMEG